MKLPFLLSVLLFSYSINAQKSNKKTTSQTLPVTQSTFGTVANAMQFRSIGPAVTSGRIGDLCVNPNNKSQWYVVAASGGVWKTDNSGTTFQSVFDSYGSYSIGCITMDPNNSNLLWLGTGENNNQRSVGYGDGIYKTEDGGKSWKNMGLKTSEHIGMIAVDPNNSNIVYVAAYGPLWSSGGERGIYKTIDGGINWTRILNVSENTGFNEIHIVPGKSNVLYATAHQRRRHEWTYLGGGPESAIYSSTDGGINWKKLEGGLPKGDLGRISVAIPQGNTDIVYALIEATENGGFYKSSDRGASWTKQSGHTTAGNYYCEIFADPINPDKIYSMNTWAMVSIDGGKTFKGLGEKNKHVDNHVIWVDKDFPAHYLMGCDGGLYETWDAAGTWDFKANIPVTQFYRVTVDNSKPFYYIYGGTQDNNTLGGPSRTISSSGIHNLDWFVTVGGDGFKTVVDPKDPDIVYSQWQYGGLVRYNRKTGEAIDIKPQEGKGDAANRFNWDAPIVLSQHDNKTLYFASQFIYKSTDMGSSWKIISPDLSRGIDRNKLPVMGKIWSVDAVAKNQSTSIYGNVTAFAESPKNAQLLYAGTDDGLIQVSSDGGKSWIRIDNIIGIPKQCLVQNIYASKNNVNEAWAIFNNHRNGDFKPYLVKSIDQGKSWQIMTCNLPERGSLYCLAEDYINPELLFAGTEFGVFTSIDAGKTWEKLGNLPTVCVREIVIQERENDLVLATFGRGFYVLDDYSALQHFKNIRIDLETKPASIFPIKPGLVFVPSTPLGHKGKSFQGASLYTAENPSLGAVINYYIRDEYKTLKEIRKSKEEQQENDYYPSIDSLRIEDQEPETYLLIIIKDVKGNIIRQYKRSPKKGMNRLVWDGYLEKTSPVSFYTPDPDNPYEGDDHGAMALPGDYQVSIQLVKSSKIQDLCGPINFKLVSFNSNTGDESFNQELSEFRRVVTGVNNYCSELANKVRYVKQNSHQINDQETLDLLAAIDLKIRAFNLLMYGDGSRSSREFETLPGLIGSLEGIVYNLWATSQAPTGTYINRLAELKLEFNAVYQIAKELNVLLEALDKQLDKNKFPYTPGRLPEWKG
ncbi:MAG: glycosyl hydrolase [Bacteroidia bacterium]|nr:glycosyl hydrolase [Bacteroidia bacterium]